ncbi:MAG: hypothetical protein OXT65_09640 [Alphaproteobacteria bacterium]|nr:hypothetical protein [Alphaproteobacteria bacterium]
MLDKNDCYPHKLFRLDRCMGVEVQRRFAEGQLKRATETFLERVKEYCAATGGTLALTIEQKEEILPYLQMLADSGWVSAHGYNIIVARNYDTKSLDAAETAFKSIGDFAAEKGLADESGLHIAMHYIGTVLEDAVKAGYNPNQPRHPAGSSVGGQWRATGGGGASGGGSRRTKPASTPLPKPKPSVQGPRLPRSSTQLTPEQVERINRRAPEGIPPEDLLPNPAFGGYPTWYVEGAVGKPAVSPTDVISGAGAARSLGKLTVTEATSAVAILKNKWAGSAAARESSKKIEKAAKTIEDYLGGKPDRSIFKEGGDMVLTRGGKRVRFDIKKVGNAKDARPHFQVEKRVSLPEARKEKWEDVGEHWYDFLDSWDHIKK